MAGSCSLFTTPAQSLTKLVEDAPRHSAAPPLFAALVIQIKMPKGPRLVYALVHLVLILAGTVLCLLANAAPLVQAVGTSLIAAGGAGYIIYFYVAFSDHRSKLFDLLHDEGMRQVFHFRAAAMRDQYATRLTNAHQRLDVLGFGLRAFREDFGEHFHEWGSRCHVRILLLDPEWPDAKTSLAALRGTEERTDPAQISRDVRTFVDGARKLLSRTFELRLYRAIPTLNFFRIDDEAFWGPYLVGKPSRNMPTFLIGRGFLLDELQAHFDLLWDDHSRPIPPEWLRDPSPVV